MQTALGPRPGLGTTRINAICNACCKVFCLSELGASFCHIENVGLRLLSLATLARATLHNSIFERNQHYVPLRIVTLLGLHFQLPWGISSE